MTWGLDLCDTIYQDKERIFSVKHIDHINLGGSVIQSLSVFVTVREFSARTVACGKTIHLKFRAQCSPQTADHLYNIMAWWWIQV